MMFRIAVNSSRILLFTLMFKQKVYYMMKCIWIVMDTYRLKKMEAHYV